jgi:DNA adenine methylase
MYERPYPFLRWAGSKRQLLPVLSLYWDVRHLRYVEPFAGSACLFFSIQPDRAILGDINRDLITTYQAVKHSVEAVAECLRSYEKGRIAYLNVRDTDPSSLPTACRAARFIYLNRFCFNGLYRTNRSGRFNVPYGGEKTGTLPSDEALLACSKLLSNTQLVTGDFEETLGLVTTGDFVYIDPPFSVKGRRVFNEYDSSVFRTNDLHRLRQWMDRLADSNIPFVVSYAESDEADILQERFYTRTVTVRRNIAGFTNRRVRCNEVLISNIQPRTPER